MTEATPRAPRMRRFTWFDGGTAEMFVDASGRVSVAEEVMEKLFRRLGFEEVPRD